MKEKKPTYEIVAELIVSLMFLVPLACLRAWVFMLHWRWFVVPTFGLAALTFSQAFGLGLVIGLMREAPKHDDREWKDKLAEAVDNSLGMSLLGLAIGYIAKSIMGN